MGGYENIEILLGSAKYATSPNRNMRMTPLLDGKVQELEEYDRSAIINLPELYNEERQACPIFRPSFFTKVVFYNAYTGTTNINGTSYGPFLNDLVYTDAENSIVGGSHPGTWYGYPPYKEFNFYRNDVDSVHVDFATQSALTYNWTYYMSYAFENNSGKTFQHYFSPTNSITWTCSEGIPFIISRQAMNGRIFIAFRCPMKHNLLKGDYVEIEFQGGWDGINGNKYFQIDMLGTETYGSDEFIFNIQDIGYETSFFANSSIGLFKKVVDITNPEDTKSIYYVRRHKIITNQKDAIPLKAAFSQNGFFNKKKFLTSALTPNYVSRVVEQDGTQNFNITFAKDIIVSGYTDNLNRPLSELYLTVLNRGYFGWFNRPRPNTTTNSALKQGHKFNISFNSGQWWDDNNLLNDTNLPTESYSKTFNNENYEFYYNQDLISGDTMDGDFCEYNSYLQEETVISDFYHKFEFNNLLFDITFSASTNRNGYYYKPHNGVKIRVFTDYIEDSSSLNILNVPSYAFYSESLGLLRWREIYPYGFIDENGNGVNYPYMNDAHYPLQNVDFKIYPENNINEYVNGIPLPTIDDCE
jgi:hypothetical protein